uniref:Uncharacterized protein n=1 Tax=virus sp. ctiha2 TaxID=2827299 RepID=A0A8S5RGA8_9VIRU|nr:MAG TPA: hypothetical protein [virus sp. ctiha2]
MYPHSIHVPQLKPSLFLHIGHSILSLLSKLQFQYLLIVSTYIHYCIYYI